MLPKATKKHQKIDIKNKYIFEHDFSSNFHGFCKPETLKIAIFPKEKQRFSEN